MKPLQLEKLIKQRCETCEHLADGEGVFPDRCSRYEDKYHCPQIVEISRDIQLSAFQDNQPIHYGRRI